MESKTTKEIKDSWGATQSGKTQKAFKDTKWIKEKDVTEAIEELKLKDDIHQEFEDNILGTDDMLEKIISMISRRLKYKLGLDMVDEKKKGDEYGKR